jgi:hypothetical protein
MVKDDTPMDILLDQMELYTVKQMRILHGDREKDELKVSIQELTKLYDRALRNRDVNALTLLKDKYNLDDVFKSLNDGLPEITQEEEDAIFGKIFTIIHTVNPKDDRDKILAERQKRYKTDGTWRQRRYGSKKYRTCFSIEPDGTVLFHMGMYLNCLGRQDLLKIWMTGHPKGPKQKLDLIHIGVVGLINAIKEDDATPAILIKFIRERSCDPMPMEDIVDMEDGKIKLVP